MQSKQIILLHSRQPLGAGSRSLVLGASKLRAILLTDAQGIPFRDVDVDPNIEMVVKDKSAWLEFILAQGSEVEVITNDEFCLEDCRSIRRALGKGDTLPADITPYRNKWVMQKELRAQGIPTPKSVFIPRGELNRETFALAVSEIGGKTFILKPADEANLRGICVADVAAPGAEQALLSQPPQTDYMVEEFLDGPQYHVECIVADGVVTPLLVARYITPLLGLASGRPSGSVSLDRTDPLWVELAELAEKAIHCLGSGGRFVAHVELLSDAEGYRIGEVACRAPGGEVPWQSLTSCNIDLEVANLSLQMGKPVPQGSHGQAVAWVWIPGAYVPPQINKTHGVFVKRFIGTGWISQARTSAELELRVRELLAQIPSA